MDCQTLNKFRCWIIFGIISLIGTNGLILASSPHKFIIQKIFLLYCYILVGMVDQISISLILERFKFISHDMKYFIFIRYELLLIIYLIISNFIGGGNLNNEIMFCLLFFISGLFCTLCFIIFVCIYSLHSLLRCCFMKCICDENIDYETIP